MIVMMIAITPSLNAVNRSLFNARPLGKPGPLGPHHQYRRTRGRDTGPGVFFILLEAPGLALGVEHHELAAVELPRHRGEARDQPVAAQFDDEHEAVAVEGGVAERELTHRLRRAARDLPIAEQVVG